MAGFLNTSFATPYRARLSYTWTGSGDTVTRLAADLIAALVPGPLKTLIEAAHASGDWSTLMTDSRLDFTTTGNLSNTNVVGIVGGIFRLDGSLGNVFVIRSASNLSAALVDLRFVHSQAR